MVLDDSTNARAAAMMDVRAAFWRRKGVDCAVYRRSHRKGYKAGAMLEHDGATKGEYIAVFDSDFVPAADFLTRTVPFLVANPSLAFVQGRWTYLNQDETTFTRYVEIPLAFHIKAEQFVRSTNAHFLQFNGTGGVWNRRAMNAVGGWVDSTVVEDLDLSLRVYLAGYQARAIHSPGHPAAFAPPTLPLPSQPNPTYLSRLTLPCLAGSPTACRRSGCTTCARPTSCRRSSRRTARSSTAGRRGRRRCVTAARSA